MSNAITRATHTKHRKFWSDNVEAFTELLNTGGTLKDAKTFVESTEITEKGVRSKAHKLGFLCSGGTFTRIDEPKLPTQLKNALDSKRITQEDLKWYIKGLEETPEKFTSDYIKKSLRVRDSIRKKEKDSRARIKASTLHEKEYTAAICVTIVIDPTQPIAVGYREFMKAYAEYKKPEEVYTAVKAYNFSRTKEKRESNDG